MQIDRQSKAGVGESVLAREMGRIMGIEPKKNNWRFFTI
jgi:hypothetical protein